MKKFLISVDTEGDNLWSWKQGQPISTENTIYIESFQELCEQYGFIPTYLTNFEMVMDERFIKTYKAKAIEGKCEIGMHLHAWNSPPEYKLENIYGKNPYITEYPKQVIYDKHIYLKQLLEQSFEVPIISYRSGRWATNDDLFDVLHEIGITVDCSITPGISHSSLKGMTVPSGNDYSNAQRTPYLLRENLIEIPMTSFCHHSFTGINLRNRISHLLKGESCWLRPISDLGRVKQLAEDLPNDYLMFMIHSSELMPGGSPYFNDKASIDELYRNMEHFFKTIAIEYEGMSIGDYGSHLLKSY